MSVAAGSLGVMTSTALPTSATEFAEPVGPGAMLAEAERC